MDLIRRGALDVNHSTLSKLETGPARRKLQNKALVSFPSERTEFFLLLEILHDIRDATGSACSRNSRDPIIPSSAGNCTQLGLSPSKSRHHTIIRLERTGPLI